MNNSFSVSGLGRAMPDVTDSLVDENTILIQRTLRSGQSIHYNGNVVVVGDVNPGAEITAAGNVIVIGSLRGVVHAGSGGDESAVIMAFCLQPTQLRIANYITRPPDGTPAEPNYPEIASLKDGVVTIEFFLAAAELRRKINQ